ncbi:MAG: UvrD-helicase domain-containing protein, partial [Campylobacter sp.]|nr:UvrD-helicase domain-containing protein [Campylobacter sp.]
MDSYLALKASAGSGKTFNLSVRVVTLILNGAKINSIMALTFTNKAAAEMKAKIVDLFLRLESSDKTSELDAICQNLNKDKAWVLHRRDELKLEFLSSNLRISTIDSFFSSIIKSFSLNLGISPDFKVSNQTEFIKEIREHFISNLSKTDIKKLAEFAANDDSSKLESIFTLIESLYEKSDDFNYTLDAPFPSSKEIDKTLARIESFFREKGLGARGLKTLEPGSPSDIVSRKFISKDSFEYWSYKSKFEPKVDEELRLLKEQLREYFNALEEYKFSNLGHLLEIYTKTRKEIITKKNELSFADISKFTYKLLAKDDFKELLYFRLDARITHLLIDEFQDTNVLQYKILKPLIDEIVSGFGQNGIGSFFYVGDTKQSIYRFRGGVKELFDRLKVDYPQIQTRTLETNFRSDEVIVNFINELFVGKDGFGYEEQKVSNKHKDMGFVKVLEAFDSVAKTAALEAKSMIDKGVRASDIAILCWKNPDIDALKVELDNLGIKSGGVGGELLFNTPFARAILESIKFFITNEQIYALNVKALINKELK